MDEISRPIKTISSSVEQLINIMPTAPKQISAKYSPAWPCSPAKESRDDSSVAMTIIPISTWKKTE